GAGNDHPGCREAAGKVGGPPRRRRVQDRQRLLRRDDAAFDRRLVPWQRRRSRRRGRRRGGVRGASVRRRLLVGPLPHLRPRRRQGQRVLCRNPVRVQVSNGAGSRGANFTPRLPRL
ncbi:MAG: hypothetical protein AVDCRST_MAG93-741, partial [uncultured Chloroflexia bacterium]